MARSRTMIIASSASGAGTLPRVLLAALLAFMLAMLVLSRLQHPLARTLQLQALAVITPIVDTLSAPLEAVHSLVTDWNHLLLAHETNAKLRSENDRLRHWQSVAVALARENASLRELARYKPVPQTSYLGAKIVGSTSGAFGRGLLLNVGAADGVRPYQPVMDAHGLIGRVIDMSPHASRLMLITDPSSRIPVMIGTRGERAIAAGTGEEEISLLFVDVNHHIKPGDLVMSSEDGGLMPAAITLGEVVRVRGREVKMRPRRALSRAEYVSVVQFIAPHADALSRKAPANPAALKR